LGYIAGEVQKFIETEAGNGRLKVEREYLATALGDVQAMLTAMTSDLMAAQEDAANLYKVGLSSVRLLMSVGDLLIGWQLLRQAEVALRALGGEVRAKDEAFYNGKVAVASFFAKNVLPELSASRAIVENTDNAIMELDEASF